MKNFCHFIFMFVPELRSEVYRSYNNIAIAIDSDNNFPQPTPKSAYISVKKSGENVTTIRPTS